MPAFSSSCARRRRPAAPALLFYFFFFAPSGADRSGDGIRPPGRHDDPGAGLADELRGLARLVGGDEHGPARCQHAVQAARYDVARKPGCQADGVEGRGRK